MRGFPKDLLERLPMLRWEPFSPDHPVARALAALPAGKGVNRYYKGRTPLGWLCFGSLPSATARDGRVAWIDFLLAHGADSTLPLAKSTSMSMAERHLGPALLRQAILASRNPDLLEVATRHGVELIAQAGPADPLSHRMDFHALTAWENPEWIADYARLAHPWEKSGLPGRLLDAWKRNPELCLAGINALRQMGLQWEQADAPGLWFLALTDESPACLDWLRWAEDLGLGQVKGSHDTGAIQFQVLTQQALLYHSPSAHHLTKVRTHLQALATPDARPHLAPRLPDIDQDFPLTPTQWVGASRIIQWAIDWGVPTASRTSDGMPWTLWVIQNAHRSCDSIMDRTDKEACEMVAWECLQALVRAGHRPHLRARGKAMEDLSATRVGVSFSETLKRYFVLSSHLSDWPQKFERLKREIAFEKKLERRLGRQAQVPSLPRARF